MPTLVREEMLIKRSGEKTAAETVEDVASATAKRAQSVQRSEERFMKKGVRTDKENGANREAGDRTQRRQES